MITTASRRAGLACLCVTVACSDIQPPAAHDAEAEQAVVSLRVRADLWDVSSPTRAKVGSGTFEAQTALIPDAGPMAALRHNSDARNRIRVRHFKDARGNLHSIGAVVDPSGQPPAFLYAFENGRIRAVMASKYEKRGGKWLKVRSRITTFDSTGVPALQADLKPETVGATSLNQRTRSPIDALRRLGDSFLPSELHAATMATEEACFSEWLTYSATGFAVASASSALTAAVAACVTTRTGCTSIEKLFGVWLGAVAVWNVSLDKLQACLLREWINETNSDGGRVSGDTDGGSPSMEDEMNRTKKIVEDFIADAVASGHYYCTDDGSYCVYYAS